MTTKAATVDTPVYDGRATVHFYPAAHFYKVSVPERGIEKLYQPGVTTIIGMKDKSGPLMGWVANQCEAFVQAKLEEMRELGIEALDANGIATMLSGMKEHYREVKQKAATIGTVVHRFLHGYLESRLRGESGALVIPTLTGFTDEMRGQANAAIEAGVGWFDEHELLPLRMESPVWSATHGYIGTDDFIGYVDGVLSVVDYKTSADIYPEVWLQTAAYQAAYMEEHPHLQLHDRWAINVRKTGELVTESRGRDVFETDFKAFLNLRALWEWERNAVNGSKPLVLVGPLGGNKTSEGRTYGSDEDAGIEPGKEAAEAVRAEG